MRRGGGNAASPLSLSELFEKACPAYMAYGMSYEEYWDEDVNAHRMYRRAHIMRMKQINFQSWLQGRYYYDALCAVAPILRAFSKARKPNDYPKEPYDLTPHDAKEREEREAMERYERVKTKVAAFAEEMKRKKKESSEEGGEEIG